MSPRPIDLTEQVSAVVAEVLEHSPASDAPLVIDSLATAELALALEEAFGLDLPDDIRFGTVAEVAAHVSRALDRPQAARSVLGDGFGWFHNAAASVIRPLAARYYRLSVIAEDRVPRSGPAILAANHDSLLDIPILVAATPRPVWFMAKEELFRGAVGARFFRALGGFPVRRGGHDLVAVRSAVEVLRRGRLLGMYPESTRTADLLPFYPGAAWLALATGAPLVPVAIRGTYESMPRGSSLPRRSSIVVRFGEPMRPGREAGPRARLERARDVTADLRVEVEKLLAQ
jgi:1-acyl-sn-glycerol-3-phosphate acyltransferase